MKIYLQMNRVTIIAFQTYEGQEVRGYSFFCGIYFVAVLFSEETDIADSDSESEKMRQEIKKDLMSNATTLHVLQSVYETSVLPLCLHT